MHPLGAAAESSLLLSCAVYFYNKGLAKTKIQCPLYVATKDNLSDAVTSIGTSI